MTQTLIFNICRRVVIFTPDTVFMAADYTVSKSAAFGEPSGMTDLELQNVLHVDTLWRLRR